MLRASPFDALAADYDRSFTASAIGQRMRAAVWRRLDTAFAPGERVLELNCGTGEDAVHLAERGVRVLATDVSPGMLAMTRAKVERAGVADRVEVAELPIQDLARRPAGRFDGALSNFGGLNCVEDLAGAARALAVAVRPGGRALLCLMGPAVPWEWGWYLAHGEVRRAFAPRIVQRRVAAIGALVPPTYAEAWAARHPRLLAALDRWERRAETIPPLPWLADHYLIELERLP